MTQQFKFGDIVRDASLGVCVVINTSEHFAYVMNSRGDYNTLANPADLEFISHPDTERLDFVEKIINIDGMVKREMGKGWVLFAEYDLSEPKPLLRDAIDAAMQEQAAEAEAT